MFDLAGLTDAVTRHGRVARVVLAAHDGSSPREVGAAMLVWAAGQSGTIGGGALEWQAIQRARGLLDQGGTRLDRQALGPNLGQCCGGAVTLLTEVYTPDNLPMAQDGVILRRLDGSKEPPLAVTRLLARARREGSLPAPGLVQGWMVEPVLRPDQQLWIWGAGHVGRALVSVLSPLPGVVTTWVDVAQDRFPADMPTGVSPLWDADPARLVALAPKDADHLIVTFSHALDLDLCHRLLGHGFRSCGLIGSTSKWARFRSRLGALGHAPAALGRIDCPIGDPALGKHPQAIAVGVALRFLGAAQGSPRATSQTA